jgi:hypothetical protein
MIRTDQQSKRIFMIWYWYENAIGNIIKYVNMEKNRRSADEEVLVIPRVLLNKGWNYRMEESLRHPTNKKENEKRLLIQLQDNRQAALQSVPADLKKEFIAKVYPDKRLINCIKIVVRNNFINDESRLVLLEYGLRRCITTKGFGVRLIVFHNMDPELVVKIMVQKISFV